ncbi:hypothetical protein FRACA_3100002 [Frankia canadensis]|uniref:Uncharacterized protein n=1 Tax=Frankia canadensis TaxID=1836972 RepID=A0A2I2KUC3_9ACTN|nr:hypothetical protein FRACA_3100002 [Frankia canadensis]SOU56539.1 hypothetical protein FRACA_3100002 [Frankia canadensis]
MSSWSARPPASDHRDREIPGPLVAHPSSRQERARAPHYRRLLRRSMEVTNSQIDTAT